MKMSLMSLKGFRLIRFIKDDRHVRSAVLVVILITILVVTAARLRADTGDCGGSMISLPFTDVGSSSVFFCSIAEAYFSALTNGATPTTYNPSSNVPREQMAAFITRTMDQTLVRGSRRAALAQYWTSAGRAQIDFRDFEFPSLLQSDGTDIWVAYPSSGGIVVRNRGSDGKKLGTWTAARGRRDDCVQHVRRNSSRYSLRRAEDLDRKPKWIGVYRLARSRVRHKCFDRDRK